MDEFGTQFKSKAEREKAVFCPELVIAIENGITFGALHKIGAKALGVVPNERIGFYEALCGLEIHWIEQGKAFRIDLRGDKDNSLEELVTYDPEEYYTP